MKLLHQETSFLELIPAEVSLPERKDKIIIQLHMDILGWPRTILSIEGKIKYHFFPFDLGSFWPEQGSGAVTRHSGDMNKHLHVGVVKIATLCFNYFIFCSLNFLGATGFIAPN